MGNCECGHCDCDGEKNEGIKTPEIKVENLIQEIKDLGFKVEKTEDGEIKITE